MDPISVALATAWLDAVRRVQAQSLRSFVEQIPQAEPARPDRTLTDLLESALIDAGGRPQQVAAAEEAASTHLVDRSV